jgi:hypothetical protein
MDMELLSQQVARVEERIASGAMRRSVSGCRMKMPSCGCGIGCAAVEARDVGQVDRIKYVLFAARLANLAYEDV